MTLQLDVIQSDVVPAGTGASTSVRRAAAAIRQPTNVILLQPSGAPPACRSSRDPGPREEICPPDPSAAAWRPSPLWNSLRDGFLAAVRRHGARAALVNAEGTYSYHWLQTAATVVADELLAQPHFTSGDRVVLLAANSPEYVAGFYGVLLAGGVVVPLPPNVEEGRLADLLRVCECHMLVTTAQVRKRCGVLENVRETAVKLNEPRRVPSTRGNAPASRDDLAMILFTSGSTGEPKGVMLSHGNLLSNAWSIAEYLDITSEERPLVVLPFYHAFGNSILQSHLLSGATLVLAGSPAFPNSIVNAIDWFEATSFSAVPELYLSLLARSSLGKRRLQSLRYMAVAGGGLPAPQALEVARRIAPAKFYVMYGQSEATARLSYLRPELLAERPGSIGKGLDGVALEVVDELDRPVSPGELGQIRARGPNVMLGYWNDPTATSRVLRDGWLHTGDLAVTDADGFIYPRGRANALVKVSGHRVHPAEVEEFLLRRLPADFAFAGRVAVVAFDAPGQGTRLAAFLQPSGPGPRPAVEDVRRMCRQSLPRHLVPAYVEITDEFPLNDALKLDRQFLARRAASRFAHEHRAPASSGH